MAISAPTTAENNRGGSGRGYMPMRGKRQGGNRRGASQPNYRKDARMRFKNSKDPVYVAFDYLDKQPLGKLAVEFVKESISDFVFFGT